MIHIEIHQTAPSHVDGFAAADMAACLAVVLAYGYHESPESVSWQDDGLHWVHPDGRHWQLQYDRSGWFNIIEDGERQPGFASRHAIVTLATWMAR